MIIHVTTTPAAPRALSEPVRTRRRTTNQLIVALACAGQFLVVMDVSIVNVALPAIRADLGFQPTDLQWVVNAYALTFAGFLMLGGRAADLYGRKRIFVLGLVLFTAPSLVGGLAGSPGVLIGARTVQGLGAAVLSPATLTILTTALPEGPRRIRALAAWSAVGAAGGALGSLLSGVLTDYLSWRWVLLINVPVGAVLVTAAVRLLTERRRETSRRLDLPGAVTITVGLSAVTYGVIQSHGYGWASITALLPIAVGVATLAVFLVVEAWFAPAPLMPLRLLRSRSVSGANLMLLLLGASGFSIWYFLSLYLQNVLHYTALQTGLAFLPPTFMIILGARLAVRLQGHLGVRRLIALGALTAAAGFVWQGQITGTSGFVTGVLGPGLVICLGFSLTFTPLATAATSEVDRSEAGLVSGLINTSRQAGGSLGLATLATVAARHTEAVSSRGAATSEALTAGYARGFMVAASLMATVAVLVILLPRTAGRPSGTS